MLVLTEEPNSKVYERFIEWIFNKCDMVRLKFKTSAVNEEITFKEFKRICELLNENIYDVVEKYNSEEFLNEVYLKLKDETDMWWSKNVKDLQKAKRSNIISNEEYILATENMIKCTLEDIIRGGVGKLTYKVNMNKIKDYLNNALVEINSVTNYISGLPRKDMYDYDYYFYLPTEKIKQFLLDRKRLYNMNYPEFPEDVTFFIGEAIFIETISHEELTFINTKDKKTIKELSNMGLKFVIQKD